jgi:subtilisin family serine protease
LKTRGRFTVVAFSSALLVAFTLSAGSSPATTRVARVVPDELIVGFDRGASEAERTTALEDVSAHVRRSFRPIGAALVSVPGGTEGQAAERLRRNPHVRYAEPNGIISADTLDTVPNDPAFGQLWGLDNTGQTVNFVAGTAGADIAATRAWGVSTGSRNVAVAVVDSGIDYNHPDLAANIWINPGENCPGCRNNGIDDDHNGYVDDWRGWNFLDGSNDPSDDNGHGTHVAGTVGAVGNNGVGITGVDWAVSLIPVKFIGADGTGTLADAVSAILYASENGARIINASWGTSENSEALLDAIRVADTAGSLFVAAAGNSFTNTDTSPNYPSSYDVPNVISVAATDNQDQRAWFSNYGASSVDLGAPGVGIYSTWPGASYQYLDGTSMAAPHVSGTAALVDAAYPNATAVGTKALLLRTTDQIASLSGRTTTGGRLDAGSAVLCTVDPELWIDAPQGSVAAYVGDTIQLTVIATACGDPAGVSVSATANGSSVALRPRGDGLYTGSYSVGTTGSLDILVSASADGATDTKTIAGTVSPSYAIDPGGPPVTITTSVPGQNARLTFNGTAGQRVSLGLGSGTMSQEKVSLLAPDGTTLVTPTTLGNSGFIDVKTLGTSGSYTILVDPTASNTGSLTLTLYNVPPDLSTTINPGGPPVTITTSVPGQNARLTFNGTAGQQVSLKASAVTMSTVKVSIIDPTESNVVAPRTFGSTGGVLTASLPATGVYTIVVDPQATSTGSVTVALTSRRKAFSPQRPTERLPPDPRRPWRAPDVGYPSALPAGPRSPKSSAFAATS